MKHHPTACKRGRTGFTLIELLVVVAIIALLISILLPSLSRARAQARSTVCASRIAQLAKAIILYADDYDETPPFLARGWEDCDEPGRLETEEYTVGSGMTLMDWAMLEDWLMPDFPRFWMDVQEDWPEDAQPKYGTLFGYTRFENLYRCPSFERVGDSGKTQNVFNYTRTLFARKWFHKGDPESYYGSSIYVGDPESENWCGQAGPILKISDIYSASQMWMMFDERWDRHCAGPLDRLNRAGEGMLQDAITEVWMAIDPIFGASGDEVGQYHGAATYSSLVPASIREKTPPILSGNCSFYDGHVALETDPLPDRKIEGDTMQLVTVFVDFLMGPMFAQRGLRPEDVKLDSPL